MIGPCPVWNSVGAPGFCSRPFNGTPGGYGLFVRYLGTRLRIRFSRTGPVEPAPRQSEETACKKRRRCPGAFFRNCARSTHRHNGRFLYVVTGSSHTGIGFPHLFPPHSCPQGFAPEHGATPAAWSCSSMARDRQATPTRAQRLRPHSQN